MLVIVTGEFGRTPPSWSADQGRGRSKPDGGRDHWPGVFSLLAFGTGVAQATCLVPAIALASFPQTAAYSPADLAANVLHVLGVNPAAALTDALGQPFPVNNGTPIPWS